MKKKPLILLLLLLFALAPSAAFAEGLSIYEWSASGSGMAESYMFGENDPAVLAYNPGDSFTNYLLPYDTTTASYLEAARVPFQVWVRFVLRLFFIWNLVGIAFLTILYFTGYGPF